MHSCHFVLFRHRESTSRQLAPILRSEVETATYQMENGKSLGEDQVVIEMGKAGGERIEESNCFLVFLPLREKAPSLRNPFSRSIKCNSEWR